MPLSDWICMAPWHWHTRSVIYHHSPPSSSVLTSVSPYHRMGGIMRKDKQVQPGQFDKIKAPKGYRLQLCGTSQTCSVLQEYLKFPFRIVSTSKMWLRMFAPAQAELTACHYVKFPQLTWLEDRVCIQVPASGWVPQGATVAWHWISCLYCCSAPPAAQLGPLGIRNSSVTAARLIPGSHVSVPFI